MKQQDGKPRLFSFTLRDFLIFAAIFICALVLCTLLRRSDIMISDFSGVIFDFALVYDKPVIYADTEFDKSPYDAWWLDKPLWTFTALPRIGEKLTPENMSGLHGMIDACLTDPRYEAGRQEVRAETWEHPGEGAVRAANYLLAKYQELKSQEEGKK